MLKYKQNLKQKIRSSSPNMVSLRHILGTGSKSRGVKYLRSYVPIQPRISIEPNAVAKVKYQRNEYYKILANFSWVNEGNYKAKCL